MTGLAKEEGFRLQSGWDGGDGWTFFNAQIVSFGGRISFLLHFGKSSPILVRMKFETHQYLEHLDRFGLRVINYGVVGCPAGGCCVSWHSQAFPGAVTESKEATMKRELGNCSIHSVVATAVRRARFSPFLQKEPGISRS
jgi:hypothetical protein